MNSIIFKKDREVSIAVAGKAKHVLDTFFMYKFKKVINE